MVFQEDDGEESPDEQEFLTPKDIVDLNMLYKHNIVSICLQNVRKPSDI